MYILVGYNFIKMYKLIRGIKKHLKKVDDCAQLVSNRSSRTSTANMASGTQG